MGLVKKEFQRLKMSLVELIGDSLREIRFSQINGPVSRPDASMNDAIQSLLIVTTLMIQGDARGSQ